MEEQRQDDSPQDEAEERVEDLAPEDEEAENVKGGDIKIGNRSQFGQRG